MKYNSVIISPGPASEQSHGSHRGWVVSLMEYNQDRMDNRSSLNSGLGYYYYPANISEEEAFSELKSAMISRHEEEIFAIEKSLSELKDLEL